MLKMNGISKSFGRLHANENVDLIVEYGEIHGLLGENGAGKSTLMNILFGLLQPDSGTIEVDGKIVKINSPKEALELGIGMVHQHFQLVPTLTVAENLTLTTPGPMLQLDLQKISDYISEISQKYDLEVNPSARISDLSVGQQQRVEIIKLLFRNAKIIVLDEPTAVLTPSEWQRFTPFLKRLTEEGRSIVFISHKLDEQFDASNSCTVLRHGKSIGTRVMAETDKDDLVEMMVGKTLAVAEVRQTIASDAETLLKMSHVSTRSAIGRVGLQDISLNVKSGEILGIAGVDGNGQDEIVDVLLGLLDMLSGNVELRGVCSTAMSPSKWRELGGALVTADRHKTGVALQLDLADNLLVTERHNPELVRLGAFSKAAVERHVTDQLNSFDVRGAQPNVTMAQLSGGNQQKLVLAREMNREIDILIAAQPIRGLDIGAAQTVHDRILQHRNNGGATILISTELDELIKLSDRIVVLSGGCIVGQINNDESFNFDELAGLMAGGNAT